MDKLTHYISFSERVSDDLCLIIKSKGEGSDWHMAACINKNKSFIITFTALHSSCTIS